MGCKGKPVSGAKPAIRLRHCTPWPACPLIKLSIALINTKKRQEEAQRKRRKKEAAAQAALADKLANKSGSGTGSDSDLSTAALYEQIEVLQQRVTALQWR